MLQDFINAHNGQFLDFDGAYGAQCVDLVQFWSQKLGGPRLSGNAVDLQGQTHGGFFRWIANTPDGVPRAGDIMVWGEYAPFGISQYGHTSIFVSGDVNQFTSFDQNWPTGHACAEVHHANYGGVLGWLQPVCLDPAPAAPQPAPAPEPVVDPAPVVVPTEPPVVNDTPTPTPEPTKPVVVPIVAPGKEKVSVIEVIKKVLANNVVERAVKTFVQAFVASLAVSGFQVSKTVLIAAGSAGLSAVWNLAKGR